VNYVRVVKEFRLSHVISEDGEVGLNIFVDLVTHPVFPINRESTPPNGGEMSRALGVNGKSPKGAGMRGQGRTRSARYQLIMKYLLIMNCFLIIMTLKWKPGEYEEME